MNIPGFAAESSLGPAMGTYIGKSVHFWTNRGFVAGIVSITPQQSSLLATVIGSGCFGSVNQCIADHCDLDDPRQRAACQKACKQPAVCTPCRCRCLAQIALARVRSSATKAYLQVQEVLLI
jgi:hypothetical protein